MSHFTNEPVEKTYRPVPYDPAEYQYLHTINPFSFDQEQQTGGFNRIMKRLHEADQSTNTVLPRDDNRTNIFLDPPPHTTEDIRAVASQVTPALKTWSSDQQAIRSLAHRMALQGMAEKLHGRGSRLKQISEDSSSPSSATGNGAATDQATQEN